MINNDRIVPIQKCDFLTMIGIILNLTGDYSGLEVLKAEDVEGNFIVATEGDYIADQPVKKLMVESGVACQVFFVAGYDFEGVYYNDEKVNLNIPVKNDGITLYSCGVTAGTVLIGQITPSAE